MIYKLCRRTTREISFTSTESGTSKEKIYLYSTLVRYPWCMYPLICRKYLVVLKRKTIKRRLELLQNRFKGMLTTLLQLHTDKKQAVMLV